MIDIETWSDGTPISMPPPIDGYEDEHQEVPDYEPEIHPEMPDFTGHIYEGLILEPVDSTQAWQTIALSWENDDFMYSVVSRGPIPIVSSDDFEDIADNIEIQTDPEDLSYRKIHIVTYEGDFYGLEMFRDLLTGNLDRGAEGDRDVIRELNGPRLLLKWALGG